MWLPIGVFVSLSRTAAFSGLPAPSMTSWRSSVLFLRAASMRSSPGLAPLAFVSKRWSYEGLGRVGTRWRGALHGNEEGRRTETYILILWLRLRSGICHLACALTNPSAGLSCWRVLNAFTAGLVSGFGFRSWLCARAGLVVEVKGEGIRRRRS